MGDDLDHEKLIDELQRKRDRLSRQADQHRARRDELNDKTKEWANRRDDLNGQVRELIDKAHHHRSRRDELNAQVQEEKKRRDEFNQKANEAQHAVNELKQDRAPQKGPSVDQLEGELRRLEFDQQTKVLSPDKERDLVDRMKEIKRQIKEKEQTLEQDAVLRDAIKEAREAKEAAEEQHQKVTRLADDAQVEHDAMVEHYEQADQLRKEADEAQEKFVESKLKANKEHQTYIDVINQIRDYEKVIAGLRKKVRKERVSAEKEAVEAEAEEIYERFQAGEKLDTEDLMVLQKAGLL